MNGSQKNRLLAFLDSGERSKAESISSDSGKNYTAVLIYAATLTESALKNKDYDGILALEETFQEHDTEHIQQDKELAYKMYQELKHIKDKFELFKNQENVQKAFSESIKTLKISDTRHRDSMFERSIRAQTRYLGSFIGARATYAERRFYEARQDALLSISREHQKNIDRAMGYSKDKKKDKELSQNKGLSR